MHPPLWHVFAFTGLWIHLLLPGKHSPLHTMYSLLCCWGVWYNKEYINLVGIIYSKSNTVISSWIKAQQVSGRCKHACHGLSLLLVALPTTSNYMGWQATYAHILIRFRFICLAMAARPWSRLHSVHLIVVILSPAPELAEAVIPKRCVSIFTQFIVVRLGRTSLRTVLRTVLLTATKNSQSCKSLNLRTRL